MKKPNILLVEADKKVVVDLSLALAKFDYKVFAVTDNGEEAITLAANPELDLVLINTVLAGNLDGISAAKMIAERSNLPIVYLSSTFDQQTLDRAKVTNPYGYLLKPFEDRNLHATLQIALFNHQTKQKLIAQTRQNEISKYYYNLGKFVQGLSYESNNLLTIILGNLNLAESMLEPNSELGIVIGEVGEAAKEVRTYIAKLALLTESIAQPQLIKVTDLIQDAFGNLDLGKCDYIYYPTDYKVRVDAFRVVPALEAVIQNAIESMPEGGTIRIRVEADKEFIRLEISDEGTGIELKNLEIVFEPCFTTKNKHDGLGLTIAQANIISNKGKINLNSTAGKGTTVQIFLPSN